MEEITARVGNRATVIEYPYPDGIKEFFQFKPKGYHFSPKYKLGVWDGTINMMKGSRVGTGLFLAFRKEIEADLNIKFQIIDKRVRPKFLRLESISLPPDFEWMEHQHECIRRMMKFSGHGGIILNATGTGKTVTAGGYFKCLRGGGVFFVDELTLLQQAHDELELLLEEDVGIVGGGVFNPQRITVATLQTAHLHRLKKDFLGWFRTINVALFDELHLCINNRTKDLIQAIKPEACFGLTATLRLSDDQVRMNAYNLCGKEVYQYPYREAVDDDNLCPGVVVGLDILRTFKAEDYADSYDTRIVRSKTRNQLLEDVVREGIKRGKKILLLVDRPWHVELLSKRFADIDHEKAHGKIAKKRRLAAKERMEHGDLQLIIANTVFKKGINIKACDVVIDGASMLSGEDSVQKLGRAARKNPGKLGFIYFDVGDKRKGSIGGNVFRKSTLSRRRALTKLGLPILTFTNDKDISWMYDKAEKKLAQVASIGLHN
jgi:superfamily II DNA or RNA helicase